MNKPVALVHPTGTVPLDSKLYIRRESDHLAEKLMNQAPSLVHILGPRQMGKSSLLLRLAQGVRDAPGGPLVININFQELTLAALHQLPDLLVQLAWVMLDTAGGKPERAASLSSSPLTPMYALKQLFGREVLARHPQGVLLAFDEVDRVVQPGGCARDFFAMLRSWHEAGKGDDTWKGLRIALCFCTEAYLTLEGGGPESPLENVGQRCHLRDFRRPEIADLLTRHGLEPAAGHLEILEQELGGNPFLVRRALYAVAAEGETLEQVMRSARRGEGPLGDHLHRHLRHLEERPALAQAMDQILQGGAGTSDRPALRALEGAGLLRRQGTAWVPRYPLYAAFLRAHL